ncbi:hypothetical protein PG993_008980 [Apiospora rasikravindrae]|uniref:Uncharacterized protein n=1 Tax=Apiospora rasikravindrae TaxID=990691 RepID=A0ABR1SI23_9PEZI
MPTCLLRMPPSSVARTHPEEYLSFCTSRSLPLPDEEVPPVLFKIFMEPDGVDFHVKGHVASELHRRFGVDAEDAFKSARASLAHLKEEAKIEVILTGISSTTLKAATSTDSWIGELDNPLEPLAIKAMKIYRFTRGNMLLPNEAGFTGHDPAKMRFDNM